MTKSQKQYMDSFSYEAIMSRAFRSSRDFEKGIDNSIFRMLEHIENGHATKSLTYPKQLQVIKSYLAKAVTKVQQWKLTAEETTAVDYYAAIAAQALNGDVLAEAINGLLDATHRLKEG